MAFVQKVPYNVHHLGTELRTKMMLEDRSERIGFVEALLLKPESLVELIQDLRQQFRTYLTAGLESALELSHFSS
jgi:hypothetical protein